MKEIIVTDDYIYTLSTEETKFSKYVKELKERNKEELERELLKLKSIK